MCGYTRAREPLPTFCDYLARACDIECGYFDGGRCAFDKVDEMPNLEGATIMDPREWYLQTIIELREETNK